MTNARLDELRAKFQENPRRYFAPFANELRKAGDPAQAISVCRAHLAGQPGHVSGHIVLGQALYEAGEANEARDVFTAALDLDPENLIALRSLGEIAQVNGEFNTARQWYERLLDADPRNPEVSQLLKDMPAEAPAAAVAPAPIADAIEEPTPLSVRQEIEEKVAEPEEAPRSTFHTSFTGSGRAYEPREPEPTEALVESSPTVSEDAFIDLEPSAHREPAEETAHVEPPVMAAAAPEAIDMVDFDSMPQAAAEEAAIESESPDESFEPIDVQASAEAYELGENTVPASEHSVEVEPGDVDVAGTEFVSASEPLPFEEVAEPPRAMFAERGFDSKVDDNFGWMTTPSAAFSDPEAAPEDWFDEPTVAEAEDVAVEQSAEEPAPVTMSEPDHANDSWFPDVESAEAIESADVTSDDLWLPPELPRFGAAEEAAPVSAQPAEEPVQAAEVTSADESSFEEALPEVVSAYQAPNDTIDSGWSSPDETAVTSERFDDQPESSWMQREETTASIDVPEEIESVQSVPSAEHEEPAVADALGFDVHAMAEAADEAFIVERHAESSSVPTFEAEAQPVPEAAEPFETASMQTDVEVIHAGVSASPDASGHDSIGRMPENAEAEASVPPAPFITETLAELYLQQGFRDEALSIYRQLVVREPYHQALKDRIAAIEKGDVPQGSQTPEIPAEERAASQSVRTFFSRLARRPAAPPHQETAVSNAPSSANPDVPFAAAASALANLFSASKPQATDEGAASTLAGAYSDPAGRPSRAADRELSLDHLFRDVPPGGSPTGGVTLDEFYSTPNAAQGSSTEPGEATGSEESGGTDIRQFTAWLEGLRKK